MNGADKSNLIIEEANEIVENYIKKKREFRLIKSKKKKHRGAGIVLSVLTTIAAVILLYIIKFI